MNSYRSKMMVQMAQRSSNPTLTEESFTSVLNYSGMNTSNEDNKQDPLSELVTWPQSNLESISIADDEHTIFATNEAVINSTVCGDDNQSLNMTDLITLEDLGIEKENEVPYKITEESMSLSSNSHSTSIIDDSCEDPDYENSSSAGQICRNKRLGLCAPVTVPDSDTSNSEYQVILKPKRRKTILKRKILTEEEKVQRNKNKYPMIPTSCQCSSLNSKNMCHTIDENKRRDIWNTYWSYSYTVRRKWLSKCVMTKPVKRITVNATKNRKVSREYYFEDPATFTMLKVCQSFFLKTLGYTSDAVITSLMKVKQMQPLDAAVKENRGKYKRPEPQKDNIKEHINSYHPCISHYRRYNAPYVRYLPHGLTLKSMYKDYVEKNCDKYHSIELYRQVMKDMNVSLHTPKSDMCSECEFFKLNCKAENTPLKLRELSQYAAHIFKAQYAIALYRKDASTGLLNEPNTKMYAVDLQKVFLIPMMPGLKDSFFVSRLIAFNLTFASLKKGEKSTCVVWHEETSERDAKNIIDAFYKLMKSERDVRHFIFWADNCTAQNKNWFLFTSLVKIVNESGGQIDTITINYLTKGHTHNAADSIHGNIERAFKRMQNIYDFDDFKSAILKSRKNLHILEINPLEDKYNWLKKKRQALSKNSNDPLKSFYLSDVISAQFRRGSRNLFYKDIKKNLTEYTELDFMQKRFDVTKPSSYWEKIPIRRGINQHKKNAILTQLVPYMPENRRTFWRDLQVNNDSGDLVRQQETIFEEMEK